MNAAGASNQMYQNNYMPAVQQGAQNYGNAAQMNQNFHNQAMGNTMQGMGNATGAMQGAMGTMAGVGANQTSEWDRNMGVASGIGGIMSGFGSMLGSDDRMKEDIEPTDVSWIDNFNERLMALMG